MKIALLCILIGIVFVLNEQKLPMSKKYKDIIIYTILLIGIISLIITGVSL